MDDTVDPAVRQAYESSGGKLACMHCGRIFTLKPATWKGCVVFPSHNVARRASRYESLPDRCSGSDIVVRVATSDEIDAEERAFLIDETVRFTGGSITADQLAAMSKKELEQVHCTAWANLTGAGSKSK